MAEEEIASSYSGDWLTRVVYNKRFPRVDAGLRMARVVHSKHFPRVAARLRKVHTGSLS